jgi:tripartite-type tricarboxylate transporter receptor subunit TctC
MHSRRYFLAGSAAGFVLGGAGMTRHLFAQLIGKATRIVVGFPPGGFVDVVARHLSERMRGTYAPTVIVDNKPGAGGRIAVEAVKNSDGDGSTILVTPNPMITIYPHLYGKLAYDPLHDLMAVTTLCTFPLVLVVGPGMPANVKTIGELVPWAKANPKKASYGTSAAGSTQHFIGFLFARAAGIELTHVGYKGGGPAIQDLLGGQIPIIIGTPGNVIPHLQAGKLRALATTGAQRSSIFPNIPTFKESGYPEIDMKDWLGLFVPSKTPPETVAKLNTVVREVLKSSEIVEAFAKLMVEPRGESPAECARLVQAEYKLWGPIVKASGFVGEN